MDVSALLRSSNQNVGIITRHSVIAAWNDLRRYVNSNQTGKKSGYTREWQHEQMDSLSRWSIDSARAQFTGRLRTSFFLFFKFVKLILYFPALAKVEDRKS